MTGKLRPEAQDEAKMDRKWGQEGSQNGPTICPCQAVSVLGGDEDKLKGSCMDVGQKRCRNGMDVAAKCFPP